MPYITADVYVDIDSYIEDASNLALREEVERRVRNGDWSGPVPRACIADEIDTIALAADLRMAFYQRDASRIEMLLMQLEAAGERPVAYRRHLTGDVG